MLRTASVQVAIHDVAVRDRTVIEVCKPILIQFCHPTQRLVWGAITSDDGSRQV